MSYGCARLGGANQPAEIEKNFDRIQVMGYNVRFEKAEIPGASQDQFNEREWQSFQAKYPTLDYAYFAGGSITCKNPSEDQLKDLARIAYRQGWRLRGDDGEYYDEHGNVIAETPAKQGFFSAVKSAFANARAARELERDMQGVECPFKVGDRVRNTHRRGGVVTRIDKRANSGLGIIEVTFPDGAVIGGMFPDGGFELDG